MKLSDFVQGLILVALKAAADDTKREPPTEFLVFPYGTINSEKGTFKFTPEACDALLAERSQHSADVQIDYDHLAIKSEKPGDGKAAGWCKLEKRDDGLWAVDVKWTPTAAQMLRDGEYRYFSPYFGATKDEKLIVLLMNIAITNLPAMHQIEALVAASRLEVLAMSGLPGGTIGTSRPAPPPAAQPIPKKESTKMAHKLGGYLAKMMKAKGMSMKALGDGAGFGEDRARQLHDGADPTAEEMSALAKHFGLKSADELEEHMDKVSAGAYDGGEVDPRGDEKEDSVSDVKAGGGAGINPSAAKRGQVRPSNTELEEAALTLAGLTGTSDPKKQREFLDGLVAMSALAKENNEKVKQMEVERSKERLETLIARGKREGKMTPPLIRKYLSMKDVTRAAKELEADLDILPVLPTATQNLQEAEPSAVANILTAEEIEVCRMSNVPVDGMAKFVLDQRNGKTKQLIYDSYRTVPQK